MAADHPCRGPDSEPRYYADARSRDRGRVSVGGGGTIDARLLAKRRQLWGWCPQNAQDLTAADLPGAEDAVLLAKDEITGRGLNTDDAYTDSVLASHRPPPTSQG